MNRSNLRATVVVGAVLFATAAVSAEVDHTPWDNILLTYVSNGKVDYAGLTRDRTALDRYLRTVGEASGDLGLAFYINAYNATVVASILDHNQPAKVLDVKGFFKEIKHPIAKRQLTLDELEIYLRNTYQDPRIHFALNCAAQSCPPLYNRAFREKSTIELLGTLTTRFLNGGGVLVDESKKELAVSRLFEWYKDDFVGKAGSIERYLRLWITEPQRKAALDSKFALRFQEYSWTLNRQ